MPNGGRSGLLNDLLNVRGSRPIKTVAEVREMIKTYANSMEGS